MNAILSQKVCQAETLICSLHNICRLKSKHTLPGLCYSHDTELFHHCKRTDRSIIERYQRHVSKCLSPNYFSSVVLMSRDDYKIVWTFSQYIRLEHWLNPDILTKTMSHVSSPNDVTVFFLMMCVLYCHSLSKYTVEDICNMQTRSKSTINKAVWQRLHVHETY